MQDITLDFETYYDADYSLRKMMTAEYIHDTRFEVIGVGIKAGDAPAQWFTGTKDYLRHALGSIDWPNTRMIAHNAIFDGAILEWVFGFRPAKYLCTMMGSRPHMVPYTGSMGLEAVANHLKLGQKGAEVENHKGRNRVAFTPEQLSEYGSYCKQDVELSFGIAAHLDGILPADERDLIDLTIKKFTRPVLLLDIEAINGRAEFLKARKALILSSVEEYGMKLKDLRSRPAFMAKLLEYGVVVPNKMTTNSRGEPAWTQGMSKKDPGFLELLTHPNAAVRQLVIAKLEVGSTIEESRLERFSRLYHAVPEHKLPIPLLYYGAHPGRFSGLDGLNMQNLPRPRASDPDRSALRKAMRAPDGWTLIAADYSTIEARILAALARQDDLLKAFRLGVDVYSKFASRVYRREILKARDPVERFVGKTCILGLGYGMGPVKLQLTLATSDPPVAITKRAASDAVALYRNTYTAIPELWQRLEELVRLYCAAPANMHTWGPLAFTRERIILPNGMPIIYAGLSHGQDGGLQYGTKHVWGGLITENVVQALARIVATRAELRLAKAGLRAVHQAHDELVFCVPEEHVDVCEDAIRRIMTDPVPWLPKLPIAVEIHHGPTYGDCR